MLTVAFVVLSCLVTVVFLGLAYRADKKLSKIGFRKLKKFPKVSVIITTYNSSRFMKKKLEAATASTYPNKEIIIVDDNSTDNTVILAKRFKNVKIIITKKRLGKGRSLNYGARRSSGELILFLDSDTILQKDTIEKLVSSHDYYQQTEGMVGFIAPKYKISNKNKYLAQMAYMEQAIHQFMLKMQMNFKSILSIRGCCLLVSKNVFFECGEFSHTIMEDGDFSAKITRAGYNIKYEPRTTVETYEHEKIGELFKTRERYGKGALFCVLNYPKHFIFSRQSLLCFYPYVLISIAFVGFSIYNSSLFSMPLFVFLTTIALKEGITTFSVIGIFGLISSIGMFLGGSITALDSIKKASIAAMFLPYIFLYVPFVGIGYVKGALSGVNDRLKKRSELNFKDW